AVDAGFLRYLGRVRYFLAAFAALAAWELFRYAALTAAKERLRKRTQRFAEAHGVRVDLFKFCGKQLVREELFNDLAVHRAVLVGRLSCLALRTVSGLVVRPPMARLPIISIMPCHAFISRLLAIWESPWSSFPREGSRVSTLFRR